MSAAYERLNGPALVLSVFFYFTRCIPVCCYGHPIIYKATHKTYNKNFSIEGITSEEWLEVERTDWYVNMVIFSSDYDKYTQNDTLRLFKIYAVMRRSYCLHTVWYVNMVIFSSDYDKYTQNDTLRLFKIYAVMRRSYCLQWLVGTFSKHLLHAPQDRRRNYVA
jgi:hypothetical protein